MRRIVVLSFGFFAVTAALAFGQSNKPLTNEDVLRMLKAGFDEQTVIKAIEAKGATLDTSVDSLLVLKQAGVSDKVMAAALSASGPKSDAKRNAESKSEFDEIGVYVLYKEKTMLMEPEIVTMRTGGVFAAALTSGIASAKLNGSIKNPKSTLRLAGTVEVTIKCPEGVSAMEYQLLRLDEKKDHREFQAAKMNLAGSQSGANKNAIDVKFEKVAPRTYKASLTNLKKGEYGFLPPGAALSSSTASSGKIYSFGIIE